MLILDEPVYPELIEKFKRFFTSGFIKDEVDVGSDVMYLPFVLLLFIIFIIVASILLFNCNRHVRLANTKPLNLFPLLNKIDVMIGNDNSVAMRYS